MRAISIALLCVAVVAEAQPPSQARPQAPAALIGRWEGHALVRSQSLGPEGLPVAIVIHADGSVTGTIGDAELVSGRVGPNRTVFARLFGLGEPWKIEGDLRGPMVIADSVTRRRTGMPVHLDGENSIAGDLNATGGGKLISVRLWLERR